MLGRPALLVVVSAASLGAAPARAAAPPVRPADIDEHLRALAEIAVRNGGNRAAGLPGVKATARYLAPRLQAAGRRVRTDPVSFPFPFDRGPAQLAEFTQGRDSPWCAAAAPARHRAHPGPAGALADLSR